jgi:hypothetical protein
VATSIIGMLALIGTLWRLKVNQESLHDQTALLQEQIALFRKESEWSLRPWFRLVNVDFFEAGKNVSTTDVKLPGWFVEKRSLFLLQFSNVGRTPALATTFLLSASYPNGTSGGFELTEFGTIVPGDEMQVARHVPNLPKTGRVNLNGVVTFQGPSGPHELSFEATFDASARLVDGFEVKEAT